MTVSKKGNCLSVPEKPFSSQTLEEIAADSQFEPAQEEFEKIWNQENYMLPPF
jgi:hypothetical protein